VKPSYNSAGTAGEDGAAYMEERPIN
jgi:hypothetical protein